MEPENKSKKGIGIAVGVIIVLGILSVTVFQAKNADKKSSGVPVVTQTPPETTNPSTPPVTTFPKGDTTPSYTLAEVATHSNSTSCWTIVRTGVYDVTSWINNHPGGPQAILSLCGKDGTAAFENQHGGQARPENELKTFFIGNYKK
jgi:hypothetical protein